MFSPAFFPKPGQEDDQELNRFNTLQPSGRILHPLLIGSHIEAYQGVIYSHRECNTLDCESGK